VSGNETISSPPNSSDSQISKFEDTSVAVKDVLPQISPSSPPPHGSDETIEVMDPLIDEFQKAEMPTKVDSDLVC
jgi:hypothetical protein